MSKQALAEQDKHLDDLVDITKEMKHYAQMMNEQIDMESQIIKKLDNQMDHTQTKLSHVQKKLGVLLKTSDRSQISTIMNLTCILFALIFLVIYI
jgi:ABC-type Fe3+-hydroxamate transport system substrate-binding protein